MRREVNSGPLSERTFSGRPRSSISRSSTRVTRPLPRLVSASSARHSRVYASTTLRMRTILPVARPSTMKSIAHSWLGRIRRGSGTIPHQPLALPPPHRQPLLHIQPVDSLHVHLVAATLQQRMQPSIAVARLLPSQLYQLLAQFRCCGPVEARTDSSTRSTPSSLQAVRSLSRNSTETNATSSLRPASSSRFFGSPPSALRHAGSAPPPAASDRRFSSSIAFSRCASLTSMPPILRLPAIERRRADPVLPAKIRRLHPGLMLLQDPDDLLFRVPALLHRTSSRSDYERTPVFPGRVFRGQGIGFWRRSGGGVQSPYKLPQRGP